MVVKKHIVFIFLIPFIILSQWILLRPHLEFGLIDLDDGYIYEFRHTWETSNNVLDFAITFYNKVKSEIGISLALLHQFYYVGILSYIFGDNFRAYQEFSHWLKIISVISVYPLFYIITKNRTTAILSLIFFNFSPSAVGTLESAIYHSDYLAITFMSIFLIIYFNIIINKNKQKLGYIILAEFFMLLSLIFSTERTFPLVLLVFFIELILIFMKRNYEDWNRKFIRWIVILGPIFIVLALQPSLLIDRLSNSLNIDYQFYIKGGRSELLLNPFITLGSTVISKNLLHGLNTHVAVLVYFLSAAFFSLIVSQKPIRFLLITIAFILAGTIISQFLTKNVYRMGYSWEWNSMAILGFYVLGASVAFLIEWIKSRERLYLGLFLAPLSIFLFITSIWVGSEIKDEIVIETHRYLSAAAVFSSLFLGNLIYAFYKNAKNRGLGQIFTPLVSLIIFFLIFQNIKVINNYFKYKLVVGSSQQDKNYMRQQLLPYYQNLDAKETRLIYVDTYTDQINNQFYGTTIHAGWNSWPIWWKHINFRRELLPILIIDYSALKKMVVEKNGKKMLYYNDIWHEPTYIETSNFFAVKLINREVVDITASIKQELGLIQ